jgi:hypothetical protein
MAINLDGYREMRLDVFPLTESDTSVKKFSFLSAFSFFHSFEGVARQHKMKYVPVGLAVAFFMAAGEASGRTPVGPPLEALPAPSRADVSLMVAESTVF